MMDARKQHVEVLESVAPSENGWIQALHELWNYKTHSATRERIMLSWIADWHSIFVRIPNRPMISSDP